MELELSNEENQIVKINKKRRSLNDLPSFLVTGPDLAIWRPIGPNETGNYALLAKETSRERQAERQAAVCEQWANWRAILRHTVSSARTLRCALRVKNRITFVRSLVQKFITLLLADSVQWRLASLQWSAIGSLQTVSSGKKAHRECKWPNWPPDTDSAWWQIIRCHSLFGQPVSGSQRGRPLRGEEARVKASPS